MNGRPMSLRSYVLIASLEPMVLVFNHHAGHVYIAGEQVAGWLRTLPFLPRPF